MLIAAQSSALGATIAGTVWDATGRPLAEVRIDHIGKLVVVVPVDVAVKPSPDDVRTDSEGHFHVVTNVPAVVIRKPGYESQRVQITGDAELQITLMRLRSTSRCRLACSPLSRQKTRMTLTTLPNGSIKTKQGSQGIISGSGPLVRRTKRTAGVVVSRILRIHAREWRDRCLSILLMENTGVR